MAFNKYTFLEDLIATIEEEIQDESIQDEDAIQDCINWAIDNELIYYANCVEIMQDLALWQWDNGEKNVQSVAYYGLSEYVYEQLDVDKFLKQIEKLQNENKKNSKVL